ncbi:MAG: hypothetical protein Kow0077_02610 [Anaerolineae bacterium]
MSDLSTWFQAATGILERTFAHLQTVFPLDYGGIIVMDERESAHLRIHTFHPPGPPHMVARDDVEATVSLATATLHNTLAVTFPADPNVRAIMAVPLVVDQHLYGVLVLGNHDAGAFTNEQLTLLQTLAPSIALSLAACEQAMPQPATSRHTQRISALQRIAVITSTTLDVDSMLTSALDLIASLFDSAAVLLTTLAPNGRYLVAHQPSARGFAPDTAFPAWPVDGYGHVIHTYHTGQPYLNNDTVADEILASLPLLEGNPRRVMTLPLNTRSRTHGTLTLLNKRTGPFTGDDLVLARTVAGQIAVSLESALLFAAERARADHLALINQISQNLSSELNLQSLLEKTVHELHTLLGHECVTLLLYDDSTEEIEVVAQATDNPDLEVPIGLRFPRTLGTAGRAITSKQTQYIPDLQDSGDFYAPNPRLRQAAASCLTIPLRSGNTALGALDIVSTKVHAFTETDRNLMQTLAAQITTAIENARHFQKTIRQAQTQQILREATVVFSQTVVMSELALQIAQTMLAALEADCVTALLLQRDGHYQLATRPSELPFDSLLAHSKDSTVQPLTGPLEDALRQGPLLMTPDHIPPGARLLVDAHGRIRHTHLLIPMIHRKNTLGVIEAVFAAHRAQPDSWALELAEGIAYQAGFASENVNLIEELERRARELSEASRLKSEFLASISHELRTPMNAIIGFSEALVRGTYGELPPRATDRLDRILRNSYNLLALIDDLLDISRIEAGRMELHFEPVALASVVAAAVEGIEHQVAQKGLQLNVHIPDNLPPVRADALRLRQVMNNLLSNAIKFTHEGQISIEAGTQQAENEACVWCRVRDTGIGIAPDYHEIIFDEFRQVDGTATRTYGGTGLGLAITRKLLAMMGGSIRVESAPGQGSTFTFRIPIVH